MAIKVQISIEVVLIYNGQWKSFSGRLSVFWTCFRRLLEYPYIGKLFHLLFFLSNHRYSNSNANFAHIVLLFEEWALPHSSIFEFRITQIDDVDVDVGLYSSIYFLHIYRLNESS